jgi:hypothetical protein
MEPVLEVWHPELLPDEEIPLEEIMLGLYHGGNDQSKSHYDRRG